MTYKVRFYPSTPVTHDELKEMEAKHTEWLLDHNTGQRMDLSKRILTGMDLTNYDFTAANMRSAHLEDCILSNVDFTSADLNQAHFNRSNLFAAKLRSADLSNARMFDVNAGGADFTNANMKCTHLVRANLKGADFFGAMLYVTDLTGSKLTNANFNAAVVGRVCLEDTNLFFAGEDRRGFLHYCFLGDDNHLVYRAGCRCFQGIDQARHHWLHRHEEDTVLRQDCLSLVARAESMAYALGWPTNPEGETDR